MSTPLSDPDNVLWIPVEENGFTDDEVQRILNGDALVASASDSFHLPGRHDQDNHGSGGGGGGGGGGGDTRSSGKSLKVTHVLVHRKHAPGTTIAVTSDGKKRVRWDGKKYELQQKQDDGSWQTEQTAIKSKAYKAVNDYADNWTEPTEEVSDESVDTSPKATPTSTQPTESPVELPSEVEQTTPSSSSSPTASSASDELLRAYADGYTIKREFTAGLSGSKVELLELANGDLVVRKTAPSGPSTQGNTSKQEYLAGRVYSALSEDSADDKVVTARVDDNTIITTYVKGETGAAVTTKVVGSNPVQQYGSKAKARAAVNAEVKRQVQLKGGKKIAMLDWLTRNNDRHNLNWMVNEEVRGEESVEPVDQGYAFFVQSVADQNGVQHELVPDSPFVDYWLNPKLNGFESTVRPKFTKAELARYRTALEALKNDFEREDASEWFNQMMARLTKVEAAVKK